MIDRLYLDERTLKALEIDSRNLIVRIKIDTISRISKARSQWGFCEEENIKKGALVFSDVCYLEVSPAGIIPGDYIIDYDLVQNQNGVEFSITTIGQPNSVYKGDQESRVTIKCGDCWLEDENKNKVL